MSDFTLIGTIVCSWAIGFLTGWSFMAKPPRQESRDAPEKPAKGPVTGDCLPTHTTAWWRDEKGEK